MDLLSGSAGVVMDRSYEIASIDTLVLNYYETIAKRLHASATQLLRIDIMLTSYFSN